MKTNYNYNKKLKGFARSLRNNSTKAEIVLWSNLLRAKTFYGYSFLRQRPIGNYIADFMCKELMLIIEVDGYSHLLDEVIQMDIKKEEYLKSIGFTIIRFTDDEVLNDINNVQKTLESFLDSRKGSSPWPPSPSLHANAQGGECEKRDLS